jgi:hypothetical protein
MRTKRYTFIYIAALVLGALLLARYLLPNQAEEPLDMQKVAAITGLQYPPSARLIEYSFSKGFSGGTLAAKLAIDSEDAESIKSSLPPIVEASTTDRLYHNEFVRPSWWAKESEKHFTAIRLKDRPDIYRYMIFIYNQDHACNLYLYWRAS